VASSDREAVKIDLTVKADLTPFSLGIGSALNAQIDDREIRPYQAGFTLHVTEGEREEGVQNLLIGLKIAVRNFAPAYLAKLAFAGDRSEPWASGLKDIGLKRG
jgi:hypothetical protein